MVITAGLADVVRYPNSLLGAEVEARVAVVARRCGVPVGVAMLQHNPARGADSAADSAAGAGREIKNKIKCG